MADDQPEGIDSADSGGGSASQAMSSIFSGGGGAMAGMDGGLEGCQPTLPDYNGLKTGTVPTNPQPYYGATRIPQFDGPISERNNAMFNTLVGNAGAQPGGWCASHVTDALLAGHRVDASMGRPPNANAYPSFVQSFGYTQTQSGVGGENVNVNALKPGDVVVWTSPSDPNGHVGMMTPRDGIVSDFAHENMTNHPISGLKHAEDYKFQVFHPPGDEALTASNAPKPDADKTTDASANDKPKDKIDTASAGKQGQGKVGGVQTAANISGYSPTLGMGAGPKPPTGIM